MTQGWVKKIILIYIVLLSVLSQAHAQFDLSSEMPSTDMTSDIWCVRGNGAMCTLSDLAANPSWHQIIVLPTGYTSAELIDFRQNFERMVIRNGTQGPEVYSSRYRQQIAYIGVWRPGGPLNQSNTLFHGGILNHPLRGKALTMNQDAVYTAIDELQRNIPGLRPWAALVIFNTTQTEITATSNAPSFLSKPYGISKCTRESIESKDFHGIYVAIHELAHSGLNFLDEYVEPGFENISIQSFDALTPLALWDGGIETLWRALGNFLGIYSIRISEILAANGNDNIDTSRYPSRVSTPSYTPNVYEFEGGMFFGRGAFHDRGANLMTSNQVIRSIDDGFAFAHSSSQQQVIEQTFERPDVASRPNDRIRNAGPVDGWVSFAGNASTLLFDSDKNHHYHRTHHYDVQVGWYERRWKVCWALFIPLPCYDNVWQTAQRSQTPTPRHVSLMTSRLYGLASSVQGLLCSLGIHQIGAFNLCSMGLDQMVSAFVPTIRFPLPYQETTIPTPQWFTTYFWRFRTDNTTWRSGWTGWSTVYRVF